MRRRLLAFLSDERGVGEYVALAVSLFFLLVIFSIVTAFYNAWTTESKLIQAADYVVGGEQEYGGFTQTMQNGLTSFCQNNGLDPSKMTVTVTTTAAKYGSQVQADIGYDYQFVFAGLESPWIKYLTGTETGFSQWAPGAVPATATVAPSGFSGTAGQNTTLQFRM